MHTTKLYRKNETHLLPLTLLLVLCTHNNTMLFLCMINYTVSNVAVSINILGCSVNPNMSILWYALNDRSNLVSIELYLPYIMLHHNLMSIVSLPTSPGCSVLSIRCVEITVEVDTRLTELCVLQPPQRDTRIVWGGSEGRLEVALFSWNLWSYLLSIGVSTGTFEAFSGAFKRLKSLGKNWLLPGRWKELVASLSFLQ